jgi:DNA polymerase I-like protein with 3'-5' exonuclease and polymerase domains
VRFVIDCETTGLDPHQDQLVLVGVTSDTGEPLVLRHPEDRDLIQQLLDADAMFVGHNLSFDLAFLEASGYRIPAPERWEDTVLVAHTAGERLQGQTRLARLTRNLIELGQLPEDILEPEHQLDAWLKSARRAARKEGRRRPEKGDAPAHLLHPYLEADLCCTRAVHAFYGAQAAEQGEILQLERACMPAVYAAERRGVPLDLDAAHELRDRLETTTADLLACVFEHAGRKFNVGSARQLEEILRERGVPVDTLPRTPKSEQLRTNSEALKAIDDELARALLAWKAEKKMLDFVRGLYGHVHRGRLFGSFNQVGTDTGRMSSSRPNLQNLPKQRLDVRYVIAAGTGKTLVAADLDNVEMRVLSCYAPGGALERAFRDGIDLHQQTADAVGVEREIGKRLNYAIVYGGGAPLFSRILKIDVAEAEAFLARWYALYPEVGELKQRLWRVVNRRGYLVTIGGRRHYFDKPNHMLLNRLVSGGCADLFKRAVIALHAAGVDLVLLVHDEAVAEVAEDDVDRVARLLETELARPATRGLARVDGLIAEATSAKRWSQFKDPDWTPEPVVGQVPLFDIDGASGA